MHVGWRMPCASTAVASVPTRWCAAVRCPLPSFCILRCRGRLAPQPPRVRCGAACTPQPAARRVRFASLFCLVHVRYGLAGSLFPSCARLLCSLDLPVPHSFSCPRTSLTVSLPWRILRRGTSRGPTNCSDLLCACVRAPVTGVWLPSRTRDAKMQRGRGAHARRHSSSHLFSPPTSRVDLNERHGACAGALPPCTPPHRDSRALALLLAAPPPTLTLVVAAVSAEPPPTRTPLRTLNASPRPHVHFAKQTAPAVGGIHASRAKALLSFPAPPHVSTQPRTALFFLLPL